MIIVKLMGGHSNQLFQYATGRRLAKKRGVELKLDITSFDNMAPQDTPRYYELDCYQLKASIATPDDLSKIEPEDYSKNFAGKLAHKLRLGSNIRRFGEVSTGFNKSVLSASRNTYLIGWWQNERYFSDIRDDLLKELEPSTPISKINKKLIEQIKASESIWIHVRRGDYITNKHANVFHGFTGIEYYKKALQILVKSIPKERQNDIKLFVCSNDIAWCKKNLKFPYPITYIVNKQGSDDMRVAKQCKHDILANSTFSWWGAWLNENPNKIVIAPKVWFQDQKANTETEIVPPSWIRI
jgi:hypothetical protein